MASLVNHARVSNNCMHLIKAHISGQNVVQERDNSPFAGPVCRCVQ